MTTAVSYPAPAPATAQPARGQRWEIAVVALAALVAMAMWVPFLHRPLTSDETGFLLIAQQWRPGHSLYGDLWVDRPPLLIWLFGVAGHLGSGSATANGFVAPGVKVLGALASGVSVGLAGVLASLVAPAGRARRTAVVLAAALLSSPLLGMPELDGELLAVPFVLTGLACAIAALRWPWGWRTAGLAVGAGATGMAAALIKQNVVDVFVFTAVLVMVSRGRATRLRSRVAGFAVGGVAVLCTALAGAWTRGTSIAGLWEAVVLFRGRAAEVIDASSSAATPVRGAELAAAALGSGAAVVLVLATAVLLRRRTDFTWPVLALTAWEVFGIAAGGSYWLHYLTGIVPGLVLLVALARSGRRMRRALAHGVTYAVAVSLTAWTYMLMAPAPISPEAQVSTYLREHSHPTDGVVVGFGHAEIAAASGLRTPYENLWSLPVRVRDPDLTGLRGVMAGSSAPQWVVVDGGSLDTWGLDADNAQQYLVRHYVERVNYDSWHVWERR